MTDPAGLDLAAFQGWIDREHPAGLRPEGVLGAEVIAGGRSNLTYRVSDGSSTWVVRRPPLGHVLPTAHDMVREFRVITGLAGTDVPVPTPIALCSDPDVLGAAFYVMNYIDGIVLDSAERITGLSAARARGVGEQLIDTLVALHAVNPTTVGLGDFGRPGGFLTRQLERWHKQSLASHQAPRELEAEVVAALRDGIPESGAPAIVHGDYRLTNVLFDAGAQRLLAVVDWEMATLGDPLTDVGLLFVYHRLSETDTGVMPVMRTADGFLSAEQLLERYQAQSGRDLSAIGWYVAFGFYKLAIISEGIAARYAQGLTVGAGFQDFGARVPVLLEQARDAMRDRRAG